MNKTYNIPAVCAACALLLVAGCASGKSSYRPIQDWTDVNEVARQQEWFADNCTSRFFGNDKMCRAARDDIYDARQQQRRKANAKQESDTTPITREKKTWACAAGHSCRE